MKENKIGIIWGTVIICLCSCCPASMGKNKKQRILFLKIYLLGNEMYLFVFFGELELCLWLLWLLRKHGKIISFLILKKSSFC